MSRKTILFAAMVAASALVAGSARADVVLSPTQTADTSGFVYMDPSVVGMTSGDNVGTWVTPYAVVSARTGSPTMDYSQNSSAAGSWVGLYFVTNSGGGLYQTDDVNRGYVQFDLTPPTGMVVDEFSAEMTWQPLGLDAVVDFYSGSTLIASQELIGTGTTNALLDSSYITEIFSPSDPITEVVMSQVASEFEMVNAYYGTAPVSDVTVPGGGGTTTSVGAGSGATDVPEPGLIAGLGLALLGLGAWTRRRNGESNDRLALMA